MEHIQQILVMEKVASCRKDLQKHGLGERRQTDCEVQGVVRISVLQQNVPQCLGSRKSINQLLREVKTLA